MKPIKEPTNYQCSASELVYEDANFYGYAMWHPQMGGYVAKCVVLMDKSWHSTGGLHNGDVIGAVNGGCIDMYVWHNGEFPFSEKDGEKDTSAWEAEKKGPGP